MPMTTIVIEVHLIHCPGTGATGGGMGWAVVGTSSVLIVAHGDIRRCAFYCIKIHPME